jgi:hypothetical protein
MAAKKHKVTTITPDQAEWLEEELSDIIGLDLSHDGAVREIVKRLKCPKAVATILVRRAETVRGCIVLAQGSWDRSFFEDVVEAYASLERIGVFFAVKGRKRYQFRVD